jgi:hypothetical protein
LSALCESHTRCRDCDEDRDRGGGVQFRVHDLTLGVSRSSRLLRVK